MAKLYGVGVGPGDWELMTLKAIRVITECEIVAIPQSGQAINAAYGIAMGACKNIEQKERMELFMPMTRDADLLSKSHDLATERIIEKLSMGKNVAFLTLGDPSVYSTYSYIHERVKAKGYETEIIPGIPSFCAVAAKLNEGLTEADQALHIIPASYGGTEEALSLPGTKVLMKSGKSVGKIKAVLQERKVATDVKMVERCGMKGERVFLGIEEIDENAGYFSILVVKDQKEE